MPEQRPPRASRWRTRSPFDEARAIDRREGDEWAVAVDQVSLAAAIVRRGRLEGHALVTAAPTAILELDDPDLLASSIQACALAALLVGGADGLRAAADVPGTPFGDAFLERELGPARAALGRAAFEEAVRAGAQRSLEDLVAAARLPL